MLQLRDTLLLRKETSPRLLIILKMEVVKIIHFCLDLVEQSNRFFRADGLEKRRVNLELFGFLKQFAEDRLISCDFIVFEVSVLIHRLLDDLFEKALLKNH